MVKDIEYSIEASGRRLYDYKELWQYRELFYFFTWRDVKVKYKQTVLGVAWVILQPVLSVLILTLFIGHALNVPSAGLPYPVFVFSGMLIWSTFSSSINSAGNSMISNAPIIKKIYFPRIIIPISSILVCLIDLFISFVIFLALVVAYQVNVDWVAVFLFWPAAFALMLAATLGTSCLLAALTVKYRDFRFVIPFALQIGLFVTPVIYPASVLNDGLIRTLASLNPLYGVMMLFRAPLGVSLNQMELFISTLAAFCLLFWGLYYFRKTEAYFADIA